MTQFHSLKVSQIEHQTEDAVVISIDVPPILAESFRYVPGQHLTLRANIAGIELRRCYSICSALGEPLQIAIKSLPDGRFSRYLTTEIQVGDLLDVMTPQGHFAHQPDPTLHCHYMAIAGGSGITPILSIISSTLAEEPYSSFTLIYCNRSVTTMMFRQTLAELKDRYPSRLQLLYIMSQEQVESPLLSGRLDAERLHAIGNHFFDWQQFDQLFLCGPEEMIDTIETALLAINVPTNRLHRERFLTHTESSPSRPQLDTQQVTLRLDSREFTIEVDQTDHSILDAALRQGTELPYSCKGGVCAACKCRVIAGQVAMGTNYSLEQDQLIAGFILSCQSLPLSEGVVLDFDQ